LWKRANEEEKILARQDLEALTNRACRSEIDLVYFDQSGFNLWAKVVYAWQKRGERILIPVTRSKQQNVLGFMWHGCHRFESFVFEGGIDAGVVIDCFDRIAARLERETVIVIDNAPMHTSEEFDEKTEEWAKLGLTIYRLPAYCPELNKIEMLWAKIKYDWLSWEAYKSEKSLRQELDRVLSQIGTKYQITFI
jgi:transposase